MSDRKIQNAYTGQHKVEQVIYVKTFIKKSLKMTLQSPRNLKLSPLTAFYNLAKNASKSLFLIAAGCHGKKHNARPFYKSL
jgi:hypothetical protein